MELEKIRDVGIAAAARAGNILCKSWGRAHHVEKKGSIDLVTEADLASEEAILRIIKRAFPDHKILTEERGATPGTDRCEWIIDPLDGTTNYAHHLPEFSISIAFAYEGDMVFGVILSPVMGELFCAVKGQGATMNGRRMQVSGTRTVADSLLVTGFPYHLPPVIRELILRLERCILAAQGVRRLGSAALDLCYVACGRFDGFWEQNLAPWDTAAGTVIVREAGGRVTTFSNEPFNIEKKEILATNGHIHREMTTLLSL